MRQVNNMYKYPSFSERILNSSKGTKLLQQFSPIQSLSFSTKTENPQFNVMFFCPRNERHFNMFDTDHPKFINDVNPKSVSVSDVAHRSENNLLAIKSLLNNEISPSTIIPHLSLIGHTKEAADEKIRFFRDSGIKTVLLVRGNPATLGKDSTYTNHPQGYKDVPNMIGRVKDLAPDMEIIVAGYPEKHPYSTSLDKCLDDLKEKVDYGADKIVTQHFFTNYHLLNFLDQCQSRGINLPIIPSIMPVGNINYLIRFSKAANINIPSEVVNILFSKDSGLNSESRMIENKEVEEKAVEYTAKHVQSLIELDLPQIDRINLYAANNIPFLRKVFAKVGVETCKVESQGR